MKGEMKKAVDEFVNRLQKLHSSQISDIFLYGSQARGDQKEYSDVDILIIANTKDWRFKHELSNIASDVSLEFDILLDTHVISQENWEKMRNANFSYYQNIISDGIAIAL